MWIHFSGGGAYDKQLNMAEFRLACKTLCRAHAHEDLSDEQIAEDFGMLDANNSGSIGFMEVRLYLFQIVMFVFSFLSKLRLTAS